MLLLSVVLQGYAVILSIVPMLTYVTDAFSIYSASALTAVLITRCLAGTFLPLTTAPLTDRLGYGYGFTCLAAACLALAPIPVSKRQLSERRTFRLTVCKPLVMRYGTKWRQRSKYSRDGDET
jgi:hypothetical protein